MAVVGIRSRDQIWQLLLVGVTTSLLLVAVGITVLTRGGDDSTSAEGVGSEEQDLTAVAAGPSDGGDSDDNGARRSGGPVGVDKDSESESTLKVTATIEATTSTPVETTLAKLTTTTTAESSTTVPSSTTSSAPVTTIGTPTTTVAKPPPTEITIEPTVVLPPHNVTPKDLAAARKRWARTGYDSYQMTVTRWCFCPRDSVGPFEVTVRGGEVSIRHMDLEGADGDRIVPFLDPQSLTVPGLFNLIESSMDGDGLNVVFDKKTGVPLTIEIDRIALAVDDELTVEVRDFRPLRGR